MNNKIVGICIGSFTLSALLVAANEFLDIPFHVFNAPPTPVNWTEIFIEVSSIFVVGAFTTFGILKLDLRRKRAEEKLSKHGEHLEELVEQHTRELEETRGYADDIIATVREPLVVLNADLQVILANRSFFQTFQVTPGETEGQYIYDLGNQQWDIPALRELLEQILPKNTKFDDFKLEHDFETIGRRTMLLNARRIYRETHRTQMILLAIEDISERKKLEEQLFTSERLATLGQFSGNISHELRNPLAVIDSSVYYMEKKLKDADGKVLEHLGRIKSSVDKSTAIIESLLNLTRMQAPRLEKLDFRAIISDAIATAKVPSAVEVVRNFPEQELLVNVDGEQLRMAFKNIIKNAVEAMNGKGTLTITARLTADNQAEVSFADTGSGIAAENLDKVFQPLFSTRAKGIGFGLSIVRMIIDKHKGTIETKSEPGKGADIIIRLPGPER